MLKIDPRKSVAVIEFTVQDVKNSCEELSNLTYEQAIAVCELLTYVYCGVSNELLSKLESVQDGIDSLTSDLDDVSDTLRDFKNGLR